jgi:hypothetical protein
VPGDRNRKQRCVRTNVRATRKENATVNRSLTESVTDVANMATGRQIARIAEVALRALWLLPQEGEDSHHQHKRNGRPLRRRMLRVVSELKRLSYRVAEQMLPVGVQIRLCGA